MMTSFPVSARLKAITLGLLTLLILLCPGAHAQKKSKTEKEVEKDKPKKQKVYPWSEFRTQHFAVATDANEKTAREIAGRLEQVVSVFQATMPDCRVSNGIPIRVLIARDGETFAHIMPEFPYDRHHEQAPGVFFAGPEKTYIALRANAGGKFRYEDVYQNYAHDVLRRSYRDLPPWLDIGFAGLYGSLIFTLHGGVQLDRPDPEDLSTLFESPLLPVDLVIKVDHTSPYYSSGNKNSVYFAESRVLTHYLVTDPEYAGTKSMEKYITAVQAGADSLKAAEDAFGNINQLQAKLHAYVNQVSGLPVGIPVAPVQPATGAARPLSEPESQALIADFAFLRGRTDEAEGHLEDALDKQPMAGAEQTLGFLNLKRKDYDEAQQHFEKAAQLDANDGLTFYGEGLVGLAKYGLSKAGSNVSAAFEKSVALNPDFAPAWYHLALVYSQHDDSLPKALDAAKHAASLAPGDSGYQLEIASILNLMGRGDEARNMASHLEKTAADSGTANQAGELLAKMSPKRQATTAPPRSDADVRASEASLRIENKTDSNDRAPALSNAAPAQSSASGSAPSTPDAAAAPAGTSQAAAKSANSGHAPHLFEENREYSMMGTVASAACSNGPQMQIVLKSQFLSMTLHASDASQVSFKPTASAAASKGVSCSALRGRMALISYFLSPGKPWDGEIQSIEIRGQ